MLDPLATGQTNSGDVDSGAQKEIFNYRQKMNVIVSMTVDVPSYEEKQIDGGKNNVVFFKIVIGLSKGNKQWVLLKRYSDFDSFDKVIRPMFSSLPSLPGKTIFKLSQQGHIEDRRVALTSYLKVSLVFIFLTLFIPDFDQSQRLANISSFPQVH